MGFNQEQINKLKAPLSSKNVAQRKQGGVNLSYIEGFFAIDQANNIFGFDGWSHEIVSLELVNKEKVEVGYRKEEGVEVCYKALVKITVGDQVHTDVGTGSGKSKSSKDAYELAMKEAVTDAMKRALRHWGNQFGNCLYDKTQANVSDDDNEEDVTKEDITEDKIIQELDKCSTHEEIEEWRMQYRETIMKSESREKIIKNYKKLKTKLNKGENKNEEKTN